MPATRKAPFAALPAAPTAAESLAASTVTRTSASGCPVAASTVEPLMVPVACAPATTGARAIRRRASRERVALYIVEDVAGARERTRAAWLRVQGTVYPGKQPAPPDRWYEYVRMS
jgi:hypothetical protein